MERFDFTSSPFLLRFLAAIGFDLSLASTHRCRGLNAEVQYMDKDFTRMLHSHLPILIPREAGSPL
jgi:hypothetical protein